MSLKDAFAGMSPARTASVDELPQGAQAPKRLSTGAPRNAGIARAVPVKTAKSADPEFEAVKIYVRKRTRKAAWRKWEDAEGGDFSELVQRLLDGYLKT